MEEKTLSMPLGVVLERREMDNPWQKWAWVPVAVIPGAGPPAEWVELERGERFVRYHASTLPLELHRKETEAYRYNLSNNPPRIFVVLRDEDEGEGEQRMQPFLVTASPYEAQDYLDSGEEVVEGVVMPEGVVAWVQAFIDRHHVDEPFRKRRRRRYDDGGDGEAERGDGALTSEQRRKRFV